MKASRSTPPLFAALLLVILTVLPASLRADSSPGIARGYLNSVSTTACGAGCTELEIQDLHFSPPFYIDRVQCVGDLATTCAAFACGESVTISYLPRINGGTGSGSDLYFLQATGDKLNHVCPVGQTCGCP